MQHDEEEIKELILELGMSRIFFAEEEEEEEEEADIVVSLKDITDRKLIEDALRKSDDNLKLAQKVAHIGSWYIDIQNNELSWSDETYRMFGLPLNTPLTYEIFLNIVHPEDRDYVDRNWKAALSRQPYDIEHRIIPNAFGIKWVHEKAELIFNDKGTPLSATGTVQDITGRKQAEEELSEKVRELETFHRLAVGRELKMIELKKEINAAYKKLGKEPIYDLSSIED